MRILRSCAVAALVLMLASACSSKPDDRTGASGSQATNGTSGTTAPGRDNGTNANPSGQGTNGTGASPSPSQSEVRDFISSFASEDQNWDCQMRPGELCKVPVQGAYFLKASNVGGIQIVAFENGSSTPAEESVVRPVPAGGSPYNARFGYRIGQNAVTFTIQAYLKDDRGIVVAKSRPQTFRVNRS